MIANGLSLEFRASTRQRSSLPLVLVLCTVALSVTASADEPTIITDYKAAADQPLDIMAPPPT